MSELGEKVKASIERLKAFQPRNGEGYYLAFSGGKDSVVIKALADMAGVKYDAHYRNPSVDPPELVQFIVKKHPDVSRDVPRYPMDYRVQSLAGKPVTMWNLIRHKLIPPTRKNRYCCAWMKEDGGDGRMTVTGVRWEESKNREISHGPITIFGKSAEAELSDNTDFRRAGRGGIVLVNDNNESRRMIEQCYKRHKTIVNPIIDWKGSEVWEFIRVERVEYCGLYDCGFYRLGCIGCPKAYYKHRLRELMFWPKYRENYIRAFSDMLDERKKRGLSASTRLWASPLDVYYWWTEQDVIPGQLEMALDEIDEDD